MAMQTLKGLLMPFRALRVVSQRMLPPAAISQLESATEQALTAVLEALESRIKVSQPVKEQLGARTREELEADLDRLRNQQRVIVEQLSKPEAHEQLQATHLSNDFSHGEESYKPDELTRKLVKWYSVPTSPHLPYRMLADFELYPQWMPWCTGSKVLDRDTNFAVKAVEVSFGIRSGPFGSVGDAVTYTVDLQPPDQGDPPYKKSATVVATNRGCTYASFLQYKWTMTPIDPNGKMTKVELQLEFKAKHKWYLAMWEALRSHVVDGMVHSFEERLKQLQTAKEQEKDASQRRHGESQGASPSKPWKGPQIQDVLSGPFKGEMPICITEADGITIRHVNEGFHQLTGFSKEEAVGQPINKLLQGGETNTGVTAALGASTRQHLPASARIVNYRKNGVAFLNGLRFEPAYDNEKNTGIIFWAVLQDLSDTSKLSGHNLELIKGPQGQRVLNSQQPENQLGGVWVLTDKSYKYEM